MRTAGEYEEMARECERRARTCRFKADAASWNASAGMWRVLADAVRPPNWVADRTEEHPLRFIKRS